MKYIICVRWGNGSVGKMVEPFDNREHAERAAAQLNKLGTIARGTIHHWVEEVDDDEPKNQARA